ncbi:maleylacetoacetate isomerase [Novosphingobium sp. FSY-8]|uniref:Maleylacetoacetate isomerase n=1 Tax=Novosphingobium ovatum TaxID=1908523 RepID=A0ABW9XBD0_9SPHN|nr:maleylacetoacetate isomerase [Novosphingobium ovatum]NBC35833.1 maleylacetoacetate isomerase [Novosphingobium ovatum]
MRLHGFFRSSASYRLRIALNLKGLAHDSAYYRLRAGEQRAPAYLALNPQGLVPALELDEGGVLTQSLAICEYLDEVCPDPALLPADPLARAKVRAFAQVIACDIHPIQNLKILRRLAGLGLSEEQVNDWAVTTIEEGFDACETLLAEQDGRFCFGDTPGLADICLVPQLSNARRFGVDLRWPRLQAVEAACMALDAFASAAPEVQPDAAG